MRGSRPGALGLTLIGFGYVFVFGLSGCATTQDAEKAVADKYIGQSSDAFFSRYGPPRSYYELKNGGKVYTWVGGEGSIHIPEETKTIAPAAPAAQQTTEKTTTSQKTTGNTTVTKSTTTSFSVGTPAAPPVTVVTKEAQDVPIYCELQITVDADDDITDIRATGDTQSAGFVGSRCAEVLGVKK